MKNDLIRTMYAPLVFNEWSASIRFQRNETEVIKLEMGVKYGQGFMPVFSSLSEAKKHFPNTEIIEVTILSTRNTN